MQQKCMKPKDIQRWLNEDVKECNKTLKWQIKYVPCRVLQRSRR